MWLCRRLVTQRYGPCQYKKEALNDHGGPKHIHLSAILPASSQSIGICFLHWKRNLFQSEGLLICCSSPRYQLVYTPHGKVICSWVMMWPLMHALTGACISGRTWAEVIKRNDSGRYAEMSRFAWHFWAWEPGSLGAWAIFPGAQPTEQPRRVPKVADRGMTFR